jgi:class 3 adenylate cyclase
MPQTRKLAAILAVDVVGYSRLMGEDEAGTAKAVREHRDAARPIVAGLGGRIVKTTGDGLLLEFPSVVAAVECAIAIQKLMAERNAGTPEAKRILYRIGVNLGDVLIEGDDILGDGVNIAARLEGICEPGGVLISGTAFDHVRGRIDADFVDLGERKQRPTLPRRCGSVRAIRWLTSGWATRASPRTASANTSRRSHGVDGRSKPIEMTRNHILCWAPPWRNSVDLTRRVPPSRPVSHSARPSRSPAPAPPGTQSATTQRIWSDLSAFLKACARPGPPNNDRRGPPDRRGHFFVIGRRGRVSQAVTC